MKQPLLPQLKVGQRLLYQFNGDFQVSFQWKNPDFLFKNPDFLLKNPDFLLKNGDLGSSRDRSMSITTSGSRSVWSDRSVPRTRLSACGSWMWSTSREVACGRS